MTAAYLIINGGVFHRNEKSKKKEIDDVVVKALMRLSNAVQECFAYEHQAKIIKTKVTSRRISRNARESKSRQLFRKRVLEESQARAMTRQNKIKHNVEMKIKEAAGTAIANRQEEMRTHRKEKKYDMLQIAEQEFDRIARLEEEEADKKQKRERISSKARCLEKRKIQKENVAKSLATLRRGHDNLDSATDAMLNRRIIIKFE